MNQPPDAPETARRDYTFAFRFWAILILVASVWQLFTPLIIGVDNVISAGFHLISFALGIVGLVSAVGFWQKRKWGLYLFMLLVGLFFLQNLAGAVIEIVRTGGVDSMWQRLFGLVVGPLLLTFLYNQRKFFE